MQKGSHGWRSECSACYTVADFYFLQSHRNAKMGLKLYGHQKMVTPVHILLVWGYS